MIEALGTDTGQTLDSAVMEKGLQELNSELHFDLGGKHDLNHPYIEDRQGVFYNGRHICSMDRGVSPEFRVWTIATRPIEVGWDEADKEDVSLQWEEILPDAPGYVDMRMLAATGKENSLMIREDGKLLKIKPMAMRQVRDRIIRCGWRHTFERLLGANIPHVTRESLAAKFSVNMYKYPVGPPEVHED